MNEITPNCHQKIFYWNKKIKSDKYTITFQNYITFYKKSNLAQMRKKV